MSNTNEIPSGAYQAVINYGDLLAKLGDRIPNQTNIYNKEIVKKIHEYFAEVFKEESVIRAGEEGTFDMLCDAPFMSSFGQDLYPSVYDKAAKVMEGFATHQVFTDGNKRLAVGATLQYLASQNITLNMNPQVFYDFVTAIANKQMGDVNKDVQVGDYVLPENIANISRILRKNCIEMNKQAEYTPFGSAKNFNKEDYEFMKDNELEEQEGLSQEC